MGISAYTRTIGVPVTESRIIVLRKQADSPRTVHLRHLGRPGQTGPVTAKWQESLDGTTWNDIAGSAKIIDASAGTAWLIVSTKPFLALAAYGNVDIEVTVSRSDPDSSLPQTVDL
jgi:hypothetical protein